MRRYTVRRHETIRLLLGALERSGARIVSRPDPASAPFEVGILTPEGERLDLVCYAFTANKYEQEGRPGDEHRFQVKYGSSFHEYHELYMDPEGRKVTLFLGVGVGEDEGLFVACDPAMHNPTWFSRSVEFKSADLERARRTGWHGWERERTDIRRKQEMPEASFETEALLAFTPKNFLKYVQLERLTTGMDPGERLLIAERLGRRVEPEPLPGDGLRHELEVELGYTAEEILEMIGGRFRLRAAVRGAAAERHLEQHIREVPGVRRVASIDKDAGGDFEVVYLDRRPVVVECKNVLKGTTAAGHPRVDFQKTRASRGDPCSRYYRPEQFDVLAACLHPVTARWDYRFRVTRTMEPHPKCVGHLHHRVLVEGPQWTESLGGLLERITV